MLADLFPRASARYLCLPVLGPMVEGFAKSQLQQGYRQGPLRQQVRALPRIDRSLRHRHCQRASDVTRDNLRACAPVDSQEDRTLAGTVHALERYLDAEGWFPAPSPEQHTQTSVLLSAYPLPADLVAETFTRWCHTQAHLRSGVRRGRMRIVRNLCLYRRRGEPDCFVPDLALFPPLHQPVRPYIFTEAEIVRMIRATDALTPTPSSPLRPAVFRLALVLLYTTGLRRGELLRLCLGDLDLLERTLWVRASKFHKSRLLPLSPGAFGELQRYLRARRACGFPAGRDAPLLCNGRRAARGYTGGGLGGGLRRLLRTSGIHKPNGHLPRVHDIRHTFAVRALLRWYQAGIDVQAKLPLLAIYMGHVSIASTEYYLPFVEDLATAAGECFGQYAGGLITATAEAGGDR